MKLLHLSLFVLVCLCPPFNTGATTIPPFATTYPTPVPTTIQLTTTPPQTTIPPPPATTELPTIQPTTAPPQTTIPPPPATTVLPTIQPTTPPPQTTIPPPPATTEPPTIQPTTPPPQTTIPPNTSTPGPHTIQQTTTPPQWSSTTAQETTIPPPGQSECDPLTCDCPLVEEPTDTFENATIGPDGEPELTEDCKCETMGGTCMDKRACLGHARPHPNYCARAQGYQRVCCVPLRVADAKCTAIGGECKDTNNCPKATHGVIFEKGWCAGRFEPARRCCVRWAC